MKTAEDLFVEIRHVEQLLNTIKLTEDYIVGNNKSLCLKYGCIINSTGLDLEDRTLGK